MYAIVKTGGKQYKVAEGDTLLVEKLNGELQSTVELSEVLMLQNDSGLQIGTPMLSGAKVVATIIEQGKGPKINGFTFKPKKGIRHKYGHRQPLTRLRVDSIQA